MDEMNRRLEGYLSAYPENMFPTFPDDERRQVMRALKSCEVLSATDRLHAEWGRHIASSIKDALQKD